MDNLKRGMSAAVAIGIILGLGVSLAVVALMHLFRDYLVRK
jgi:hypothetical protein